MDRARRDRRLTLKAPAADQLHLLDLQALDTHLDQLAHRRSHLAEHAQISELEARRDSLRDELVGAQTDQGDLAREQSKAEGDVEQVRARTTRDQQRLDAGQVSSPKELESLQHEIATLSRRQGDLEDIVLDVMERAEAVAARVSALTAEESELETTLTEATARRDAGLGEIDRETEQTRSERAATLDGIDAALVELYEKVRAQQGGTGAAPLFQRRCMGCRLEINATDMARFRAADEDEVLRCEECRRILVRTAESGL